MINVLTGKRYVLLAVVTMGVSACSALGTSVAEDDSETVVPNSSMGRSIMEGLGAVPSRQTAINYTPRAPLVVPPNKLALVPPEDANRLEASGTWPEDNDLKTRKILAAAAARDAARGDDNNQLGSSELLAVRTPTTLGNGALNSPNMLEDQAKPLLPSQIASMPRSGSSTMYDATGKPVRKALVEPPVAYLEPAPGVPVSTDDGAPPVKKKPWWKLW
jgi:hypothetical protein